MKTHTLIFLFTVIGLAGCNEDEAVKDTAPVIFIGDKVDTAFLNTSYTLKPVEVIDKGRCTEAEITGNVNTSVPGTYFLDYDYTDMEGNKSATVTRTVHVVENSAAFLNGNYSAVCSCTAVDAAIAGLSKASNPTITTNNYTATVSSHAESRHFQLVPLRIGSVDIVPMTILSGSAITAGFYHRNFVVGSGSSSGTLSSTKKTFTIETTNYQIFPAIRYMCKNVYTKKLPEIKNKN